MTVVFASTADVHVLWIGEGERERMLVMENGEVVDTVGAPWPEEEAAFADEEFEADALAVTFARLTGVELLDERWLEGTFHELDCGSWPTTVPKQRSTSSRAPIRRSRWTAECSMPWPSYNARARS